MSLLGRLEDLSLPDIVQIVYLSRRTGMLEIVDAENRWGIFFVNGLIAGAFAPHDSDLLDFLQGSHAITAEDATGVRAELESGGVVGDLVLSRDLLAPGDLADLIRVRVINLVRPLLSRRTGEFNFILSDGIPPRELGYDVESLFRQGGILPAEVLEEGDKAKPLQNLEETMRAGKALLRGEKGGEVAAFGFGEEIEQMTARSRGEDAAAPEPDLEDDDEDEEERPGLESESPFAETSETVFAELDLDEPDPVGSTGLEGGTFPEPPREELGEAGNEDLFGAPLAKDEGGDLADLLGTGSGAGFDEAIPDESVTDHVTPPPSPPPAPSPRLLVPPPKGAETAGDDRVGSLTAPPQARSTSRFRVEGDQGREIADRNVVLFEKNPMLRVAAKRAFGQNEFQIFQFGQVDEIQRVVNEMLHANKFFVSFLELAPGEEQSTKLLLHLIKRTNRHLPVVVIDVDASLERRHDLLRLGCDMYLTKPSASHLQPALADQSLRMFADELVQFAEHAVQNWERLTETFEGEGAVGATLYEIAEKERLNRTRSLMRSLINELADPDDINQVSQTILRLADEYLDRAALFAASPTRFLGLGGFGPTGSDSEMNHLVRRIRIARDADSVLRDVTVGRAIHRGKLRKTSANVKLVTGLGTVQPTQVVVIPIEDDGTPVGVLYGDNAGQRALIGKTTGLEIFLEQAGLALHNAIVTNARRKGLDWEGQ